MDGGSCHENEKHSDDNLDDGPFHENEASATTAAYGRSENRSCTKILEIIHHIKVNKQYLGILLQVSMT